MRLILLGAPGSGKGTISSELVRELQIAHISTGDIFRKNLNEGTKLGKIVEHLMMRGELIPDEITIAMVENRLAEEDCKNGFILDGFLRTLSQAVALDKILLRQHMPISKVMNIHVPHEIIIARLVGRRICSQCGQIYNIESMRPAKEGTCDQCEGGLLHRIDDQPETIRRRLETYFLQIMPVIKYYKQCNILINVDNGSKMGDSVAKILASIHNDINVLQTSNVS